MHFINLHTHKVSGNPSVVEIVNQYPDEFSRTDRFSIGIHPWRIDATKIEEQLNFIESGLTDSSCLAIGECGLDKRIEMPIDIQKSVFIRQLELAERFSKPVIVHCVAAYQEVIEICNTNKVTVPVIIHGFSKNKQVADSLIQAGFYLSFGKWLARNPELASVFQSVADERYFLETDSSDYDIANVYKKAAAAKGSEINEIAAQTAANFKTVFKLNPKDF